MKPRHQVSKAAIEMIKRFEGLRRSAAQLPDGRWTIGYGHTKTAREGAEVDESDGEALLIYDLLEVTSAVNDLTFTPLTQNQFDALCCFCFNVGVENFRRSSVLRRVNEGALLQAACALEMWRKAEFEGERIVVDALVRRRAAEKALFLTPANGWVPAPSPVVRPRVDYDVTGAQPKTEPANLVASLDGPVATVHEEKPSVADAPGARVFEDAQPSASQAAAEAVSARLQALVPDEPAAEQSAEAEAGLDTTPAEPEPILTPEVLQEVEPFPLDEALAEPAQPAPPAPQTEEPVAVVEPEPEPQPVEPEAAPEQAVEPVVEPAGEPAAIEQPFALAPAPAEDPYPALHPVAEPVVEPAPAGPGLFDAAPLAEEAPARNMANADLAVRRIVDPSVEPFTGFDEDAAEPVQFSALPLVVLGVAGLFLFAGGVFWGFNAHPSDQGLLSARTLGWVASLVGFACIGAAVYFMLERLGGGED